MPRIFYIPPDDFEPLPKWMKDCQLGKSRKVGGGEGESERMMKKERERKTRGSRKEMDRMRRYEERRKGKMVKDDRRKSMMAAVPEKTRVSLNEARKNGQRTAKNHNVIRDAGKRWQIGDGLKLAAGKEADYSGRSKSVKKNLSRRHRDTRKERVVVEVERISGNEKVKEWMDKVHEANMKATSVQVSSETFCNHKDRNVDLFDSVSPWPISRYCIDDSDFKLNVNARCCTSHPTYDHGFGQQPVDLLYCLFGRPAPHTEDINDHSDDQDDEQLTPEVKCQKTKSFWNRFSKVLHRIANTMRTM
ncbi:uncharacterized protein [Haliotis cracherodii]|uniref:uncharacterized protein n=1 Tax=Haliotis cracherodii TaxID=6455 RepID=UPI0039EA56AE